MQCLTLPWPWQWKQELHLLLLHQLFAVVKALEDLDMDLVLTQLAPSGWLLGIPDNKARFKTCGQLHSAPGWYLSRAVPILSSRARWSLVSSFSTVVPYTSHPPAAVNTKETMGLCFKMQLTTSKSMPNQPGAVCLHQKPGTARKQRVETSHWLKINRSKIPVIVNLADISSRYGNHPFNTLFITKKATPYPHTGRKGRRFVLKHISPELTMTSLGVYFSALDIITEWKSSFTLHIRLKKRQSLILVFISATKECTGIFSSTNADLGESQLYLPGNTHHQFVWDWQLMLLPLKEESSGICHGMPLTFSTARGRLYQTPAHPFNFLGRNRLQKLNPRKNRLLDTCPKGCEKKKKSVYKGIKLQDQNLSLISPCLLLSVQLHPPTARTGLGPRVLESHRRFGFSPATKPPKKSPHWEGVMVFESLMCHLLAMKRSISKSKAEHPVGSIHYRLSVHQIPWTNARTRSFTVDFPSIPKFMGQQNECRLCYRETLLGFKYLETV